MMKHLQSWWVSFSDIFNWKNDEAKGRSIVLLSTFLSGFYNMFVTGIFYTGFLTMYGISITGTGILTFIPFAANLLCIFSSKILGRFHSRKKILLAAKLIYYFVYIVITTIMPNFITDPGARLVCFIIIIVGASVFYAPFSPGFTSWFYHFYPEDNERRTRFLLYMQIISSVLGSILMIVFSILTDALSNSPYQDTMILAFRYFSYAFVLVEAFLQSRAKEYPYKETENPKLTDIFTLPLKYKKFFYCMLLVFAWAYIVYLTQGLWDYHLLNHLGFSYTLINMMSVLSTVFLLVFSAMWKKMLRHFSWIKTFGIALLCWAPTEIGLFFLVEGASVMFVVLRVIQNIVQVGVNLITANLLYINLPDEDTTVHIAFYTVGTNIFNILGIATGTLISSITGDQAVSMFGMDVYSIQFVPFLRGTLILILGVILVLRWRLFTPDKHIEEIEHYHAVRKKNRFS